MRLVCVLAATTHDVPLIATIAVSLAFAFVGGLLAVQLQSAATARISSGIVVGPFTPGFRRRRTPRSATRGDRRDPAHVQHGPRFFPYAIFSRCAVMRCRVRSHKSSRDGRSVLAWPSCGDGR